MGRGSGPSFRLTSLDRLELQRLVRSGERYVDAASVVGCSAKSVQRLLVRTGGLKPRSLPRSALLAKEFGPSAWTIALWAKQAARDAGRGDGGLTTAEREELVRLRREVRRFKEEPEIVSNAAAWFATESGTSKRSSGS